MKTPSRSTVYRYATLLQRYGIVSANWRHNPSETQLVEFVAQISSTITNKQIPSIDKAIEALKIYKPALANKIDKSKKHIEQASDLYFYYSHDQTARLIRKLKNLGILPRRWTTNPIYLQAIAQILDRPERETEIIQTLLKSGQLTTEPEPKINPTPKAGKHLKLEFFDPVTKQSVPLQDYNQLIPTQLNQHQQQQDFYQLLSEIKNILLTIAEKL